MRKRLLREKDQSNIGAKVTRRMHAVENATESLLMEISKILTVSKAPVRGFIPEAAKLFETQARMIYLRSAGEAKIENDNIKAEILNGLCPADAAQFCKEDRLGLGQNHQSKKHGDTAPLSTQEGPPHKG